MAQSIAGEAREWPTIVVEVADCQGNEDVLMKVKRWFFKSHGGVGFAAKDPLIDPACCLEVWRYGVPVPVPDEEQLMAKSEANSTDGAQIDDASLTLDQPTDTESDDAGTEPVGSLVDSDIPLFDEPFPVRDCCDVDSSLSSIDDDIVLDRVFSNVAIIAKDSDGDGNYHDEDGDVPIADPLFSSQSKIPSPSSSYSSPATGSSAFHPTPTQNIPPTIPRVTNPEPRSLLLGYSDLFGSGIETVQLAKFGCAAEGDQVTVEQQERAKKHMVSGWEEG